MNLNWRQLRDSLWFLPAVAAVAAALLAPATIWLDSNVLTRYDIARLWFLFSAGAEGARGVLSAIAGGVITVTGVIFSVTIVALQLASQQYSPRVLRGFTSDRANQAVLAVFIGTFVYTLLVLRSIRAATERQDGLVPAMSITIAVLLAIASIGMFIFFIDHVARSMLAEEIMRKAVAESRSAIRHVLRPSPGRPDADSIDGGRTNRPASVVADRSGYVQSIGIAALFRLADHGIHRIRIEPRVGDYVIRGETLASVWPADSIDTRTARRLRRAIEIGTARTPDEDIERGIIELSDIAAKALSPSVNDPTTAMTAIDHLGQILVTLADSAPAEWIERRGPSGIRIVVHATSFERCTSLAFDPVVHFGASQPAIALRLLDVLDRIARLIEPEFRRPIFRTAADLVAAAEREIDLPFELTRIRHRWRRFTADSTDAARRFRDAS